MESPPLNKRHLIKRHVAGLSFVDIGGLWGTTGETVTTAVKAKAEHAVMADIQSLDSIWWERFDMHCADRGVDGYEKRQLDICGPDAARQLGEFDFVHCSGLMYHVPDLFNFVANLAGVTKRYLMLSSVVMPAEIRTDSGTLSFGADHAYLAPILSAENRRIVIEHLDTRELRAAGLNASGRYIDHGRPRFGPWWWLFSGRFMARVVTMYGLEILAEGATPSGNGYTIFAKVRSR